MERIAQFAVALVLVTGTPAVNAGLLSSLAEDAAKVTAEDAAKAAKAAKAAEAAGTVTATEVSAEASGVKVENKVGGPGVQISATGMSAEANAVKVENSLGGAEGGGGSSGNDDPPIWFDVLVFLGIGGWVLSKFSKQS